MVIGAGDRASNNTIDSSPEGVNAFKKGIVQGLHSLLINIILIVLTKIGGILLDIWLLRYLRG
jgi:hypothetical protein